MHSFIQILFTGQQLDKEIENAIPQNIALDVLPFIETKLSTEPTTLAALNDIARQNAFVVITSQIAANWVLTNISKMPKWTFACMQGQTQKTLSDNGWGGLVQYTASNSLDLAKKIASSVPNSTTIHFMGSSQRLANLPEYLKEKGFQVNELIAYNTIAKQQAISKKYDAIVFLSPSAVNSFFNQHSINEEVVLFAIGQTTAIAVRKRTQNAVVVSEGVTQLELFQSIYNYYQTICH